MDIDNLFFTSDTHFGHKNVIAYCNRPYADVDAQTEGLISNWNSVVPPESEVFHMGDFSLSKAQVPLVVPRLNGKITLIAGNHDEAGPIKHMSEKKRQYWRYKFMEWGFSDVKFEHELLLGGHRFKMSHFPYTPHDERYPELLPRDEGDWLLHGHVHQSWKVNGRQINVGVDVWDLRPVKFKQILDIVEKAKKGASTNG